MQEKKNKRLAISLVILVAITIVSYWLSVREKTISIDKDIFRVADYMVIDKVVLESGTRKVELTLKGSRWMVNDRYEADRNLITLLFQTLQQAEPKRHVAASVRDSVNVVLEETGVEVSLFSGENREQRLLAGGNTSKTQSYFKAYGQDDIYVMGIPGYRVYVSGIFELTENQWRDKYVFGFNWRNFQTLEATFPGKPSENFRVAPQNNLFGVEGIDTDTTKLSAFMDRVLSLTVDEYLETGAFTDSLTETRPFMILTITDVAKNEYSLKIFQENGNRVPGLVGERQGAVFNRNKIEPILRPKSYFRTR